MLNGAGINRYNITLFRMLVVVVRRILRCGKSPIFLAGHVTRSHPHRDRH